jgi:signal transduction histidine kinase
LKALPQDGGRSSVIEENPVPEILGSGGAAPLASRLEAGRAEILASYEHVLTEVGSLLLRDPQSREQVLAHGGQILSDVVHSLRTGAISVGGDRLLAWDIGRTRAAEGVHPRESLQAAAAFFEIVLKAGARELGTDGSLPLLTLMALTLNEIISTRIREATSGYSGHLLNEINEAHISERRRIARELHDRIGHALTTAHRQLDLYQIHQEKDSLTAANRVQAAEEAVREAMQNLRAVTSELRLQEPLKSLEKALASYLDSAVGVTACVRLQVNGDEAWASPAIRDESFLVIREAARNALAHSDPTIVLIRVDIAPHELRAWVEDDGSGFDITGQDSARGGLLSMRERSDLMGGSISIMSKPGWGSQVELVVPLAGRRDDGIR